VSTERVIQEELKRADAAFETRDFYLACFLRCAGYELVNLRNEGRRKVFVFRDRATRRADVTAFYGDATSVRPLAFHHQGHEGIAAQWLTRKPTRRSSTPGAVRSAKPSTDSKGLSSMA
jgi:hypothetical protein